MGKLSHVNRWEMGCLIGATASPDLIQLDRSKTLTENMDKAEPSHGPSLLEELRAAVYGW
jgi:hypothetical protein